MYIPNALSVAFFHGESWYKCPYCNYRFEYYQAVYGEEFKPKDGMTSDKQTFVCPECGKLFKMS